MVDRVMIGITHGYTTWCIDVYEGSLQSIIGMIYFHLFSRTTKMNGMGQDCCFHGSNSVL